MTRRATLADARAIAELQLRSWQRDYADVVPGEILAGQTVERRLERWTELLGAGVARVLVFDQPEVGVVGVAACGPMRGEHAEDGVGELYALYVDPFAQGAGVGTALLAGAIEELSGAGRPEATLWVFRDNGRARRFYERHGWRCEEGSEALAGTDWWAPAVRYRREL
jgi:ribosomal protein S18 acetylase RimI-like enzyme